MPTDEKFPETAPEATFLQGGGEMGALMRSIDWSRSPLGPVSGWSQGLRTTVGLLLHNRFPLLLWWGPKFVQFYNDAYMPIPGAKHPRAMGQPASECWAEIWHVIGPMIEAPFGGQPATWSDDLELFHTRRGFLEETHYRVAYSPVPDETVASTGIGGVLATVAEITEQVYGQRQLRTLRDLGERAADARTPEEACDTAAATLVQGCPRDAPFAAFYLLDATGRVAHLAGASGFADGEPPMMLRSLDVGDPWLSERLSLARVVGERRIAVVGALDRPFEHLPSSDQGVAPREAVVLPLGSPDQPQIYGFAIVGVSPHRVLDEGYRSFFELAAAQVVTAIRNAKAFEDERRRAAALAEIDRAKTAFFSNVSHEFRTPLTLMLGPAEDALASPQGSLTGEDLRSVHRNTLRLLKLVNTLLDFSRMEAGNTQATYAPTDLAALTLDLTQTFRLAIERAGLRFEVDCVPLPEPVHVDRNMWETIVLNLLSNAFKFTFEGKVGVGLRPVGDRVELEVRDTGVGIPEGELPRLFKRFHRIEGTRSRTYEGSGIGLSLVDDLVKLHGGSIRVTSRPGHGTAFVVSIPTGTAHLPADRLELSGDARAKNVVPAEAYVSEALRWLPDDAEGAPATAVRAGTVGPTAIGTPEPEAGRVLVADDNADMRAYLARLLRERWTVEAVADGAQALSAARAHRPDVILTDVMMPNLDGFGLLRALRDDPRTAGISVIMLSARAGEESRVGGLEAGADDYLVKPFSARELMARVETHLKLAKARDDGEAARRKAETATRTKDEFLAMLGHELRNPLSPITTAIQLMRMRGNEGRELAIIERQVSHLVRLVDDLLDVSRITSGKIELRKERLELGGAVLRGIEQASPLLEQRRQVLQVDVPAEGLPVEADAARLAQIVSNLLTNASKYSDPGSSIELRAARAGKRVRLSVVDHGIGIAADMLGRIFDLFVQQPQALDRAKGGLGLGLGIVRSLVHLHAGTVQARSRGLGTGSEFVVELPLAAGAEEMEELAAWQMAARMPASIAPADGKRILVVDDNQDAADLMADLLSDLGHEVRSVYDGPTAIDLARNFLPNVCLLDIGLPVMDGYDLAEALRRVPELPRDLRLIAITGYGQDADRRRSSEAGFDAHVVKPVDFELLSTVLRD
jgi:signal transduction histidine kinase